MNYLTQWNEDTRMKLAFYLAMLSVPLELSSFLFDPRSNPFFFGVHIMLIATFLFLFRKYERPSLMVFAFGFLLFFSHSWAKNANHIYLAAWLILPALLFAQAWKETLYATYVRITLGLVMLTAAVQKIIAGTYLDGSYFAYQNSVNTFLGHFAGFFCSDTSGNGCIWFSLTGIFIILWQLLIGTLLLANVRYWYIIAMEIAFLLATGVLAFEFNFQVLVIVSLCIAFRFAMPLWMGALCFALLFIDQLNWPYLYHLLIT